MPQMLMSKYRLLVILASVGVIAGCQTEEDTTGPGPLQVGVATVRMPVPLGIGTSGYAGFTVAGEPSPFAEMFAATRRIHGHPSFKAVVLSRGEGYEAVLLRGDMIGVFQQLRRAIILELERRLGRNLDHALVMAATHTHSGPGRLVGSGGVLDLLADTFFPEFYEKMVGAAADAVEQAYADLAPGRLGQVVTDASEGQSDRRCEDGKDHTNGALPLLALEKEGHIVAVAFSFAVHGTVLDLEDLSLSQDVAGAIEQAVADSFDRPVEAVFLNSWAGDIAPGNPKSVPRRPGADQPDGYDRMEAVGAVVAGAVKAAIPKLTWLDEPAINLRTRRIPINREVIGYKDGEFPYPYGGTFCGQGAATDCDPATKVATLDQACVPFNKQYPVPRQTLVTTGSLGLFHLVTFPGEPTTQLGEAVVTQIKGKVAEDEVMFIGFAQDYTGYALEEDDWWQGGYESNGSLWGPRQGEYLRKKLVEIATAPLDAPPDATEPLPLAPFDVPKYTAYVPEKALQLGTVIEKVSPSYGPTETVVFTVAGADPWLGAPVATLETETGDPVKRAGGSPTTSDGYGFFVDLTVDPSYKDKIKTDSRRFSWKFSMPVKHAVDIGLPELKGKYRLTVAIPTDGGTAKKVQSAVFSVQP